MIHPHELALLQRDAEREWRFKARRFNLTLVLKEQGSPVFMTSFRGAFLLSVNANLPAEERRREIARQFEYLERNLGTPEKAAIYRQESSEYWRLVMGRTTGEPVSARMRELEAKWWREEA